MNSRQAVEHKIITNRTARFYTLGPALESQPIWIVLHGYGQLASDFISSFIPADDGRRRIVAPEGLSRFYLRAGQGAIGANWMTSEDRENEVSDYVTYLDGVCDAVRTTKARIFVLGFSQGAATACRWFTHSSSSVDGIAIWGGGVPPDLDFMEFSRRLEKSPLTFVWGRTDIYMSESRFRAEQQVLETQGVACSPIIYDGGHSIDETILSDVMLNQEAR